MRRQELGKLVPEGGLFVEIGTGIGNHAAETIAATPKLNFIGFDEWEMNSGLTVMTESLRKIKKGKPISIELRRMKPEQAVAQLEDESVDLLFMDLPLSDYRGGELLSSAWSTIKPGGSIAGADLGEEESIAETFKDILSSEGTEIEIKRSSDHRCPFWLIEKPNEKG